MVGLKEDVIVGHLVPTGTGFRAHNKTVVKKNVDLQAAAAEIERASKVIDTGGPLRLLSEDEPVLGRSGGDKSAASVDPLK